MTHRAPHHKGSYPATAALVRANAYTNPDTRCWRCRRTLAEIQRTKPRARWTAGHLNDGQIGGPLAPECSPCNFAAGARLTNQKRTPKRAWW